MPCVPSPPDASRRRKLAGEFLFIEQPMDHPVTDPVQGGELLAAPGFGQPMMIVDAGSGDQRAPANGAGLAILSRHS